MKGKDKMLAAMISGLKSDFPVVIPYLGIFLRDHWDEITDQPWWVIYDPNLSAHLKVEEDLQSKLDLDWVPCGMCPSKDRRKSHRVEAQGDHIFLVNISNGKKKEIQREPVGGSHLSLDKEPLIKSMEDIDKYVTVVDEGTFIRSGNIDYAKMVLEKFGSEKFIFAHISHPFWIALTSFFGFKGILMNLFRRPKLVECTLEKILARSIEELKAYAKVGVDGIWIEECLTSANEISLAYFKRFVLPYTTEMISEIRRLGMRSIYYPCGDVRDRLELIIESSPDCVSLEEGKKGFEINIDWVNEIVAGRACIFGNLDALKVLPNSTSIELRREIRRQINIGRKYGKFVMSLGSPVTPQTPLSRVREYVKIARQESGEAV